MLNGLICITAPEEGYEAIVVPMIPEVHAHFLNVTKTSKPLAQGQACGPFRDVAHINHTPLILLIWNPPPWRRRHKPA